MSEGLKIAVIGGGIAGLSAVWLLGRRHDVTLYERHGAPGMGAFNLEYARGGPPVRIDVPLRVFKAVYYDALMALYRAAGVEIQPTDHAAAYSALGSTGGVGDSYFRYRNLHLGRLSVPLPAGFDRRSLRFTREGLRLMRTGRRELASGGILGQSLEDWLARHRFDRDFVDAILLPTFAAICTCSTAAVARYPASAIVGFYCSGSLLSGIWRARHGADDAIRRLLAPSREQRLGAGVARIEATIDGVVVHDGAGTQARFDHVILAMQANQAAGLLADVDAESAALLGRVPYESSEVVVHGDASLVPTGMAVAPVQFLVDERQPKPMASIHLNRVIPELAGRPDLYQTWNPLLEPAPETVLGRAGFERPLVTLDSQAAMARLAEAQRAGGRRLWCCGSYLMPGIPLLESAVRSAGLVAEALGVEDLPWAESAGS